MKNNEMVRSILGLLQAKELSRAGAKTLLSMLEETASAYANDRIAIVGLAARMPPGVNADEFWKCLRKGEDLVRPVPQGRAADVDHYYGNTPDEEFGGKRTWDLAYLDRIDLFDAAHFGIGAAEAELMDPAHRMFLEVSAEALQDAGLDGDAIRGTKTAVFSGNPGFHYAEAVAEPSSIAVTGNLPDFMAARVAYLYDLHGPVLSVQAACASSLVAVHEGIRALRERSCDLAIVGGATVFSFPGNIRTNPMTAAGIVSPTERCRPFSEGGDGIGRGEGVVVFVLARIKDAEERRLPVRAVLLGSAVNNDGKSAALTAPNPAAHTALLLEAWSNAGVRPEDIGYIEAHGTGTYLGDPIEIAGIRDAFVGSDVAPQTVAIGSVKGNVGHLADGGAGVSGLLKLVYGIQRQTIPPTVHFDVPNTNIDFSQTPVFVVDEEIAWPQNKEGRAMIGGVSSFGFQGTNCHVVVGPAPTSAASSDSEAPFFWPVSASTDEALRETIRRHVRFLEAQVVDVRAGSFTLSMGRRHLPCRVLFFARSQAELLRELLTWLKSDEVQTTVPEALWQDANERETLRGYVEGKVDSLAPLFEGKEQARISLPATAWNHRRHWLSTRRKGTSRTSEPAASQAVTLEQVSSLFREVLSSEDVDDSLGFLELGGNSLLATLVIAKLRARYGVELSIRDFFQDSSVKGVLNSIASRSGISNASAPHRLEPRPSFIPLSFSQERLWYLHQLNPGLGVYNLPGIVKVKGPLGVQQVRDALSVLVSRHASFQTVFTVVDGAAQQTLRDSQGDVLTVVDLHDRPLSDALTLFREDIARPFDLEKGPLLRALLARCADETSLLLINTHHIVSDGASVRILVKELSALLGSHPLTSNADAVDYPDFSVWQRSPVSVARIGKQLLFWRSYLADAPATSELPTDFPRPSEQSFRGATHEYALPSTACTRLLSMAKAEGLTPFMAMLSVFRLTLGWWTEQDDFLLGTPVSNRTIAEVENIVGYFANTVTLRLKGSKFATLRDLFRDTRETCLHAFSNQDVPFEQVVADLHPMRDLSRQPLFQLNFAYEESTLEGVQIGPYWVEPVALDSEFTKFDLTFTMVRQSSGDVRVIVEYSSDLFEKATIDRFFSSFGHAMSCFTEPLANPAAFSPLPEVETKHLLLLGQGAKMLPGPAYLSAIGALLRKKPDVVWVRDTKGSSYTGRDLLQKIGDISGALEKHTRPGDAVGICLERTADLVAAVLAVLSTGRVYVPIEPEWPEKRTKFVEKDAGLRLVLVDRGGSRSWSTPTERVDQIPTTKTAPLFESIASDRPAYIIYTSGSTGNPKGVLIAHSQLQNYLDGCLATYPRGEGPSVVHSSIAFDLTLTSMFVPFLLERPILLVAGGLDDLANTILASSAISLLKLTPSHIVALSPLLEGEPPCRIGVVIVGGEALEGSHVSSLRKWAGAVPMFNEYGPTETTVGCIVHETGAAEWRSVPIGKPMPNTTAYVLDRAMRLRPEGLVGDLWIGGSGVGVGYFGRPDLTGERFLGNPFGEGRIYKTGDRAQWKDGLLHFRGREDRQAKVNGFRIELEEIESVLTRVEGVDRAIVTARDGLEAYLLPSEAWLKRPENKLERVRWSSVFDTTYAVVSEESEDAFNITGWNDSYDNAPLPKEAMIEWRDETLARIRALGGRSIVEIGCGTGILLFPLSAHCDRYTGVDFSLQALASIDNTGRPSNVALHHRPAHDLRDLVGDTVVLNSVLQYFPSSRYLDEVLRAGIASAAKGGHFLIGDVRHAGLLDVFAASVLQHRTGTPPTVDEIAQYCEEESELVVHPAYFFDLPSRFDRVKHVEVMPKLCVADNELTRFRYDVVLHLDAAPTLLPGRVERWSSFGDARALLLASPNESIVFTGVPNPKLSKLMSLVSQRGEALVSREGQEAPSLSSLLTLADEQQRFLEFSTGTSDDGTMLVAFRTVSTTRSAFPVAEMKGPKTNEPIQNERKKSFIRQARELASRWLPSYMNPPHYRVLLDPPLTINGKIDVEHLPPIRREGRAGVMLSVPPATPAEEVLLQIWREVLGRTSVGVTENFFDAGGDSIQSIQVVARAARKGMAIQPRDMIRFPTVRELAKESVEARVNQPAPESRESAVSCSLLPIHHWFFSLGLTAPNHFNQTVLLDTPLLSGVALRLEKAVAKLTELHQALRLRFVMSDGRWNAVLGESVVAVRVHADPMTRASIEERCRTAQATLDIVNGPLGRIEYFAAPEDGRPKLLVTLHHLITDGVSFRILLMELSELLLGEERTNLPHVPTSLATWSDQVIQYAKSPVLLREIALWKRLLGSHPLRFPEETASDAVAIEGEAIVVEVALDENETTRLLESAMGTASGGVDAYFVSACVGSLLAWSKNTEILVDLDAHGREAVLGRDASRTVGWLTALVPLRVRLSESADPIACLADTLMTMQSVPHRGIGFGVLRYCADANVQREFSELPKPDVALNYLGTLDRVLAPGVERSAYFEGPWRSPSCKRIYRITADAMTLGGRLVIRWSASRNGYSQEMLEKIAEDTMNRLRTLVSPHPTKGS